MEYYKKTLCVTYEELTAGDDPVIHGATLRQNVRRGNIENINRGGGEGNTALYSYSSLPEKYKRWGTRETNGKGDNTQQDTERRICGKVL